MSTRQQLWQAKRKRRGLCPQCGGKRRGVETVLCKSCGDAARERNRERYRIKAGIPLDAPNMRRRKV